MFASDFLRFLGFKGRAIKAVRKPAGWTKTTGPYGEIINADMLQCVHCRFSWEVVVGSGIERGFCSRCVGYTCGKPACMVCIPFEQRLENMEAGLDPLTPRPEMVSVLADVPGGVKLLVPAGAKAIGPHKRKLILPPGVR